jgi:site-specific DNA recombinase
MNTATTRAAVYLRESKADDDGIERHREDCRRIATTRGWEIAAEYVDNGITASDKRKDRPAYDAMIKAYEEGEFGGLICWDLDRLTRQPRQLEDWIDAAEERGLVLVTANGEADLSTDNGRLFARIKASVARAEIERKGARERRAALQRAEHGRPPKGTRLTGYTVDGELIEAEASIVRRMFGMFAEGCSLREITAWLNSTGIPARRGGSWSPSSVRTILVNPRYAGRAIYRGEANGHEGTWAAVVDDATWDLVSTRLADPRRRTQVGTDRKHLGSSLYRCGICDAPLRAHTTKHAGQPSVVRYRCAGHVVRSAASVDAFVLAVLRERLGRPDLAGLLAPPESAESRKAAEEIKALRARLRKTGADYDADLIDGHRYKVKTEKITAQLEAARRTQARLSAGSAVAPTLTAPDPVAAFDAAPLGTKRAVLGFFMTVKLAPAPRGRHFDPDTVEILPRIPRVL